MQENTTPNPSPQIEEESIDWQMYLSKLWKGRRTIILTTIVFIALGLASALTMTRTYTSEILLAPEVSSGNRSGSLGGLASMLGMGGASMGNSTDAFNLTMYPKVIASTPFVVDLMNIRVKDQKNDIDTTLVGYLTREKGFSISALPGMAISGVMSLILGDDDKPKKKPDFTHVDPTHLTKPQAAVIGAISACIQSNVDNKTGETTITVIMDNPVIAATLADTVCSKLCQYIINYRTSKAREDLAYYQKLADESKEKYDAASEAYASYQDHNRGLILNEVLSRGARLQNNLSIAQTVYTQMAQQAEMARAKVQEEKPIFATIQPASVPVSPSNSRAKVLLIWTFLGFALSTVWVLFGPEYLAKAKQMLREAQSA